MKMTQAGNIIAFGRQTIATVCKRPYPNHIHAPKDDKIITFSLKNMYELYGLKCPGQKGSGPKCPGLLEIYSTSQISRGGSVFCEQQSPTFDIFSTREIFDFIATFEFA